MTAQENFDAFLAQQAVEGYTLGDITGTADGDMLQYTNLKIAVAQEQSKINAFYVAKTAAINALKAEQDSAMQSLLLTWQTYEDNDYTISE